MTKQPFQARQDRISLKLVQENERFSEQLTRPPANRVTGPKSSRFGTENLFSNQSTEKGIFVTDNLYFAP